MRKHVGKGIKTNFVLGLKRAFNKVEQAHICGIVRRGHDDRVFVVQISDLFSGIVSGARDSTDT